MSGNFDYLCDTFLTPIKKYMTDPTVTEIMVNGHEDIYIERRGQLSKVEESFNSEQALMAAINNIAEFMNRRINEKFPRMDARLPDGSRVHAIIRPISRIGPCLSIRKFSQETFNTPELIGLKTLTKNIAFFTKSSVLARKNIVISGGTGTGKTSYLGYAAGFIPDHERVIVIEDASELKLPQSHVIPLETRPPNLKGEDEVSIRDLVHSSLRMRPDRIIIGECRGEETLDMLQSMNTGHAGSLTTVHANTPIDATLRMETMCLMGGIRLPLLAIRAQVASAVDLIIQLERLPDGARKIVKVTEILGLEENGNIKVADIFVYDLSDDTFKATGHIPSFMEDLKRLEMPVPESLFKA
jgi:pilus assembly protein CpaF